MRTLGWIFAAGLATVTAALSTGAAAQIPTDAQKEALRAHCASDYRAHCASIPPGGMDALVCLERNVADLSPPCKSAVEAVKGGAAAPAQAAAATQPAAPAAAKGAPSGGSSAPASAPASASAVAPAAPASASAVAAPAAPALPFRREVGLTARECFTDFRRLCPDLPIGHGHLVGCRRTHRGELQPGCRAAMEAAGG